MSCGGLQWEVIAISTIILGDNNNNEKKNAVKKAYSNVECREKRKCHESCSLGTM